MLILLGICIFMFLLLQWAPGNPYMDMMKPGMTPEQTAQMLREKGYYDPLHLKLLKWLRDLVRLDLGYSIKYGRPCWDIIAEKLPNTLAITLPALLLALLFSVKIGIRSSFRPGILDKTVDILSAVGISVPTFLLAIFLIKWLGFDLPLFPISGMGGAQNDGGDFLDKAYHAVLPISVLTLIQMSSLIRYVRAFMNSISDKDYIRSYEGFGLTRYQAYKKIGFRNILPRLITMAFMEVPNLISGALITETIFVWHGIGKLNYDAVFARDYPLILGIVFIISVAVLLANLIADILNYYLDRRLGLS